MAKRGSKKIWSNVQWVMDPTVNLKSFSYCKYEPFQVLSVSWRRDAQIFRPGLIDSWHHLKSDSNTEKVMAFQQDHLNLSITKLQRSGIGGSLNGYSWQVCGYVAKGSDIFSMISMQNPSVYIQKGVSWLLLSTISYRQYWLLIQAFKTTDVWN